MRISISRNNVTRRGGNSIIELTLVLGLLLSLTFGAIEFGQWYSIKHTLQGAAREGARAAIPSGATNAVVTSAVTTSLQAAGLNTAQFTVAIRNGADTADVNVATQTAGTAILVKITGTWGTVGTRPMGLIGAAKVVKGTAVMRKEAT
jgi:Flp pilus assembly protein TadG